MRRRFRQVSTTAERWRARRKLTGWGYPRPIEGNELMMSAIFEYGDDCLFWFQPLDTWPNAAVFHVALAPESRLNHGTWARRLFQGVSITAEMLGLERLVAADCTGTGVVAGYLGRLGWERRSIPELEDEDWFVWEV